jgi:hypothetical protein
MSTPSPTAKTLIALAAAGALLAAAAVSAQAPTGRSAAASGADASERAPLQEGPGGASALTRWVMRVDQADRGLARGWQSGRFGGAQVQVPDVIDPRSFRGRAGMRNYEGSIAWYRTSVTAATAGLYALHFASANFLARVWVDGRALGAHRGSYLPFELDMPLSAGVHTLVVRVDWRDPARQAREGFHRTWFNWGGLDGPVDVRQLGASDLSDPSLATTLSPDSPRAQSATVRVSVRVRNYGPARALVPEGSLVHDQHTVPLRFGTLTLAHGQLATATATATIAAPALWSPSSPNLYHLQLAVPGESSYAAEVGLRELTWHGRRIYLNGRRLLLHGATIQQDALGHGDALTGADEDAIVHELRAIGANAARAQHPLDPGLLRRLDAAGILVWQGIGPVEGAGNWYSSSPALLAGAERQAREAALAAQLHPSIFAWNLVDEVAKNGHDAAEVDYVRSVGHWLHAHDPTRLVAVDVWGDHPPARAGALYRAADAVAETDYSGWYDSPRDTPAQLRAQMRARLATMQRTFAGKVLLISEFGAESNDLNPSASPGGYGYQTRLLAEHVRVYEADPQLSGMLIWVLRDYPLNPQFQGGSIHFVLPGVRLIEGLNQKGLFTYGGARKPAVAALAALFGSLPRD